MTNTLIAITGNSEGGFWSQVHEIFPKIDIPQKGKLFIVLSLLAPEAGRVNTGREILQNIEDTYYKDDGNSPYISLTQTLQRIGTNYIHPISIAVVAIVDNAVYISAYGGGEVGIYRNNSFSKILSSGDSVVSASGYSKQDDIVVLGTQKFFQIYSDLTVKSALDNGPQKAVEMMTPQLHANGDTSGAAGAFVSFVTKTEKTLEELDYGIDEIEVEKGSSDKRLFTKFRDKFSMDKFATTSLKINSNPDLPTESKGKKTAVSVGLILIVLLLVSIFFGARKKNETDRLAMYEPRLEEAQRNFKEAKELVSVSPERSREHFLESQRIVNELIQEGVVDEKLESLVQEVESSKGKILGIYEVTPDLFLDLNLMSDGFVGHDMSVSGDLLYVLDRESEKLIESTFSSKKSEVVAGPAVINEPNSIISYGSRYFTVANDGVFDIDADGERVIDDNFDNKITQAYAGNVYSLDRGETEVTRYPGVGSGFGDGKNWLKENIEVDLSRVVSMTIDGNIWMLDSTGEIFKFTLGNEQNFRTSGIAPTLSSPRELFTGDEVEDIYILDPNNKRVVAIDKEGEFLAQYSSELLTDAKDFGVSEEEKLLVFLLNDKLYGFSLGHLE